MEIHYVRKLMSSHMVAEPAEELTEWEERMIASVAVKGILFGTCVRENEENSLWYDITGKQSLDVVLGSGKAEHALLCRLLTGIYEAVESIEGILLQADNLLLMPECIFVDYRTEQLYFCYYPGGTKRISESFAKLMEYLLTQLNHEDERGVELAYGVYERVIGGDGGLRELKELLRMPYEREETDAGEEFPEETDAGEERPEETDARVPDFERSFKAVKKQTDTGEGRDGRGDAAEREASGRKRSFLPERGAGWLKNLPVLRDFFSRMERLDAAHVPGKKSAAERSRFAGRREKAAESRKSWREEFVFEPEEEEVRQTARPTVLLAGVSANPEGILRYEGTGECEDLVITGGSYVIGSAPDCEGQIKSATVSRKHARITRNGDVYFIEDLNSSNGTCVGGEMLHYKTRVSLEKNEIVLFADEKFRFI